MVWVVKKWVGILIFKGGIFALQSTFVIHCFKQAKLLKLECMKKLLHTRYVLTEECNSLYNEIIILIQNSIRNIIRI